MSGEIRSKTWAKFLHGLLKGWKSSGRRTIHKILASIDNRCWVKGCSQGPVWNGKQLRLEVDHIDGDSCNNDPQNLRLVCLHCHSQTPSYKVPHAYR